MTTAARILLFGDIGQVGTEIVREATSDEALELVIVPLSQADFAVPGDVARAIAASPACDVVVNAAAYTDVNRAESERAMAFRINGEAVGEMAGACAKANLPLIHISTDYVFDGAKAGSYVEDDPTCPLSVYGASKLNGENRVRAELQRHIVLRTSWVYSATGNNFVKTMLRVGADREELKIVDDQYGAPTSARDIAHSILSIAKRLAVEPSNAPYGVFNYTGGGETTWYRFAQEIFDQARTWAPIKARLVPIRTDEYPTPARRPANSRLDCGKIAAAWSIAQAPWRASLVTVLDELRPDGRGAKS